MQLLSLNTIYKSNVVSSLGHTNRPSQHPYLRYLTGFSDLLWWNHFPPKNRDSSFLVPPLPNCHHNPPLFISENWKSSLICSSSFKKIFQICLFLTVLGLCCCVPVFSRAETTLPCNHRLLTAGASPAAEHKLEGTLAQQPLPTGFFTPQHVESSQEQSLNPRLLHWQADS